MKKTQILIISLFFSLTICALTGFHVARADTPVIQPIAVTMNNSAPVTSVTVTDLTNPGDNLSPDNFPSDGQVYNITGMESGDLFSLSLTNIDSARDGFNENGVFSSTSSYPASDIEIDVTAYEQVQNTFSVYSVLDSDYCILTGTYLGIGSSCIVTLNATNFWSASAWSDYDTSITFPASTFNSGSSERWTIGSAFSTFPLTASDGSYSKTYLHQYYLTVDSAHGSPSQSSQWVNQFGSFSVSVNSPDIVTSGADQWVVFGPSSQTIGDVESAQTLSFSWIEQFYITVVSSYGSPNPNSQWVNQGSIFTVSVNSPYVVIPNTDRWVVIGSSSQTIGDVESAQTLSFSWTVQFYLSVSSTYGSQIGQGWYDPSATAFAGLTSGTVSGGSGTQYIFTGWSGDASGNNFSSSNPIVMTGPMNATANWQTQYQVTFASNIGGSTNPNGSNVWENAGSLSIMATPNTGYNFISWSSNTGSITFDNSNLANTNATIGGMGTITAAFATNAYTITVTQSPNGLISPGTSIIAYGGAQNFNITPNVGYHILGITVNGIAVAVTFPSGQSYQFSDISADGSLSSETSPSSTISASAGTFRGWVTQSASSTRLPRNRPAN